MVNLFFKIEFVAVCTQLDKEHRSALHYQQMAEDAKTPLSVAQAEIESLKKELLVAHRHELQLNREVRKNLAIAYVYLIFPCRTVTVSIIYM